VASMVTLAPVLTPLSGRVNETYPNGLYDPPPCSGDFSVGASDATLPEKRNISTWHY
jgi:hypothetical protein